MGVPVVMIVLPLFAVVAGLNILNNVSANRATLIFLYIGINVPYTTIFLTTFLPICPGRLRKQLPLTAAPLLRPSG